MSDQKVDVLYTMRLGSSLLAKHGEHCGLQMLDAHDAVTELIDKAARHIHAVDHPVNDGGDAARQERTLRALNAALSRIGGAA